MKKLCCLLAFLFTNCAHARTVTIYRGGAFINSYYFLTDAIRDAVDYDSIVLSNDEFLISELRIDKNLILQGTRSGGTSTVLYKQDRRWDDYSGLILTGKIKLTIRDMVITNRDFGATAPGGATIFVDTGATLLSAGYMQFLNNKSSSDIRYSPLSLCGAIYNKGTVLLTDSAVFIRNGGRGAAVFTEGDLIISGTLVADSNFSVEAIIQQATSATGYVPRLTISGNLRMCDNHGTAIYSIYPAVMSGNIILARNGGGVFALDSLNVSGNVRICNNSAYTGAGISSSGPLTLSGTILIDSNAADEGGGIYTTNDVTIRGKVTVSHNHATLRGGAIAIYDGTLKVIDSVQLLDNTVDTPMAAAIYSNNSNILINKGQLYNNHAIDTNASGMGMAIFTDASKDTPVFVHIANTRVFNPGANGHTQNEVYNTNSLLHFSSDTCWWGLSDTAKVFMNIPADSFQLRSWVIANWSVNGGAPIGTASSCPVTAAFTLNDGSPIAPDLFWMLNGRFSASSGSFMPAVAGMMPSNIISTTYYAGPATATVAMLGVVDADTLQQAHHVIGTGIGELGLTAKYAVYPNPSNGSFTISIASGNNSAVAAKVYDLSGRLLSEQMLSFKGNTAAMQSAASPGVYILELTDEAVHKQRLQILIR